MSLARAAARTFPVPLAGVLHHETRRTDRVGGRLRLCRRGVCPTCFPEAVGPTGQFRAGLLGLIGKRASPTWESLRGNLASHRTRRGGCGGDQAVGPARDERQGPYSRRIRLGRYPP